MNLAADTGQVRLALNVIDALAAEYRIAAATRKADVVERHRQKVSFPAGARTRSRPPSTRSATP